MGQDGWSLWLRCGHAACEGGEPPLTDTFLSSQTHRHEKRDIPNSTDIRNFIIDLDIFRMVSSVFFLSFGFAETVHQPICDAYIVLLASYILWAAMLWLLFAFSVNRQEAVWMQHQFGQHYPPQPYPGSHVMHPNAGPVRGPYGMYSRFPTQGVKKYDVEKQVCDRRNAWPPLLT